MVLLMAFLAKVHMHPLNNDWEEEKPTDGFGCQALGMVHGPPKSNFLSGSKFHRNFAVIL